MPTRGRRTDTIKLTRGKSRRAAGFSAAVPEGGIWQGKAFFADAVIIIANHGPGVLYVTQPNARKVK